MYTALIGFGRFYRSLLRVLSIYVHRRGAFGVARFDLSGNARAFIAWNDRSSTNFVSSEIWSDASAHSGRKTIGENGYTTSATSKDNLQYLCYCGLRCAIIHNLVEPGLAGQIVYSLLLLSPPLQLSL